MGDKQFSRAKEQFEDRHKGYQKSRRIAVLEQGLKWEATGLTQKDMEFLDLRRYNAQTIMQCLGMKKSVLGITDDVNYATSREQRKSWWQDTNIPLMKMITSSLNFGLLWNTPYVARWDLSTVEALQEDYAARVKTAKVLYDMGFTDNELNEKFDLGFTPKDWRDVGWAPLNMQPMNAELPPGGIEEGKALIASTRKPLLLTTGAKKKAVKSKNDIIWTTVRNDASTIEKAFDAKVKRIFFEMRAKSLKLLNKKTIEDIQAENFITEQEKISKITKGFYVEGLTLGVEGIADEVGGILWDVTYPEAQVFLSNKAIKIKDVIDTVKDRVRHQISRGIEEGESTVEIAERIKTEYNFASSRAKTIAQTEVMGSVNAGRNGQISLSGFPRHQWFTALSGETRDTHQAMHGVTVPINEPFIVGGALMMYPGDPNGPAKEVINCKCIELPSEDPLTQ